MRTATRSQNRLNDIKTPVKVYNVEKKELIATFESINQAAKFCGIDGATIRRSIRHKYRCHKNNLGFTICFR